MRDNLRGILLTMLALAFATMVCIFAVLLLAGDQLRGALGPVVASLSLSGREDDLTTAAGTDDTPVRFTIEPGTPPTFVAFLLESQDLITDPDLFVTYLQAEGLDVQIEAGTYFLRQTQTIPEIALALTDSRFSQITFSIIPGWRLEEVAAAVDANPLFAFSGADFLAVVNNGAVIDSAYANWAGIPEDASLEGFLFPNTYQLPPDITAEGLRDALLTAFQDALTPELVGAISAQDWTVYEVVTLASIVQREAVHADERPLIAGVYRNRLVAGQRLDADPTVQYALDNTRGSWWARITADDYQGVVSPYNTYRVNGLPPGPIANPSLNAIEAVIYPETSGYYYFRADCRDDGYHDFAVTYQEHLENGC